MVLTNSLSIIGLWTPFLSTIIFPSLWWMSWLMNYMVPCHHLLQTRFEGPISSDLYPRGRHLEDNFLHTPWTLRIHRNAIWTHQHVHNFLGHHKSPISRLNWDNMSLCFSMTLWSTTNNLDSNINNIWYPFLICFSRIHFIFKSPNVPLGCPIWSI